jgi:hypothetical protein
MAPWFLPQYDILSDEDVAPFFPDAWLAARGVSSSDSSHNVQVLDQALLDEYRADVYEHNMTVLIVRMERHRRLIGSELEAGEEGRIRVAYSLLAVMSGLKL